MPDKLLESKGGEQPEIFPVQNYEAFANRLRKLEHRDRVKVLTAWARSLGSRNPEKQPMDMHKFAHIFKANMEPANFDDYYDIIRHQGGKKLKCGNLVVGQLELTVYRISGNNIKKSQGESDAEGLNLLSYEIKDEDREFGYFDWELDSKKNEALNKHREISELIRDYHIGKLLLLLSEQQLKLLNIGNLRIKNKKPANSSFFLAYGYDVEDVGQLDANILEQIAKNARNYTKYFNLYKELILRKNTRYIPELKFN